MTEAAAAGAGWRRPGPLALLALLPVLAGCASLASSAATGFAANLSTAILDQDDPQLVRDGAPAYLLALDGLVAGSPDSPAMLATAANLYAAYALAFVDDGERAARLASRSRDYSLRAVCAADRRACGLGALSYDDFVDTIGRLGPRAANALFSYAIGSLAWIRTHSEDWNALTDLPRVECVLEHLLTIAAPEDLGSVNLYLGILNSLRPPALGGNPELGRAYFETALALTGGRDLSVHVEFARGYARLVYDRELHDHLLRQALEAPADAPGLTLFNTLAKQQAAELLATGDEYF
jgi:hypothetical protein